MRMGMNLVHVVNLSMAGFEKDVSGQGERQGPRAGAHTGTERRARRGWIDTPMHGSATRNPFPSLSWLIVVPSTPKDGTRGSWNPEGTVPIKADLCEIKQATRREGQEAEGVARSKIYRVPIRKPPIYKLPSWFPPALSIRHNKRELLSYGQFHINIHPLRLKLRIHKRHQGAFQSALNQCRQARE
jgi:hypothetical protein